MNIETSLGEKRVRLPFNAARTAGGRTSVTAYQTRADRSEQYRNPNDRKQIQEGNNHQGKSFEKVDLIQHEKIQDYYHFLLYRLFGSILTMHRRSTR